MMGRSRSGGVQKKALVEFHMFPCYYCDSPMIYHRPKGMPRKEHYKIRPTRDHVIPKSVGVGIRNNIVICCGECNNIKADAPYEVFIAYIRYRKKNT